jgi:hypothetical protein
LNQSEFRIGLDFSKVPGFLDEQTLNTTETSFDLCFMPFSVEQTSNATEKTKKWQSSQKVRNFFRSPFKI